VLATLEILLANPLMLSALLLIAVALIFDFTNGFHDAANSIATVVATKTLTPFQAVAMAAFFNFVIMFFITFELVTFPLD